jgi:hypothetical protein
MKGVLPWLVRWACLAGTKDYCSACRPNTNTNVDADYISCFYVFNHRKTILIFYDSCKQKCITSLTLFFRRLSGPGKLGNSPQKSSGKEHVPL